MKEHILAWTALGAYIALVIGVSRTTAWLYQEGHWGPATLLIGLALLGLHFAIEEA